MDANLLSTLLIVAGIVLLVVALALPLVATLRARSAMIGATAEADS